VSSNAPHTYTKPFFHLILLPWSLPVQNNLRLGIWGATKDLYRNSSGAAYPYYSNDSTVVIRSNDVPDLGRFYFFYNWQLQQDPCVSGRTPVSVDLITTGCASAINEIGGVENIVLQPNPTSNLLLVKIDVTQSNSDCKIAVLNILGETLLAQSKMLNTGANSFSIDVSSFAVGVYLFTLQNGKAIIAKRFVKE
jgi:hypothetical protein